MDSDDDESYIYTAERKAKQNFLNEEIIDNHYDPQLFMMFCSQDKEPDIDYWNFDELQECVHKFKMNYRRGQTLQEVLDAEAKKNPQKIKQQIVENDINNKQKIETENIKKTDDVKKNEDTKIILEKNQLEKVHVLQQLPLAPEKVAKKEAKKQEIKKDNKHVEEILFGIPQIKTYNTEIPVNPGISEVKSYNTTEIKTYNTGIPEIKVSDTNESKNNSSAYFTIRCQVLENTKLAEIPNIEFTLKAPELVEGGIFSKAYYLYIVFCSPLEWESKRRYSDYIWLRDVLSNLLPGYFIPPIPPHKSLRSSEEDIVFKRKALLTKFTAAIARNKIILSLPVVEMFFKVASHEQFTKDKKKFEKYNKKIDSPEHFFSTDGILTCTISDLSLKASAYMNYATNAEAIEKRLKRQVTTVMKDIKAMATTGSDISDLIHQLEELQVTCPYETSGKNLFLHVQTELKYASNIDSIRQRSIKEHFNMYFKYSYLEKEKMKELLKERETLYTEFEKAEIKKAKNLGKIRNMFGFYNTHVLTEIERVIHEDNEMVMKNFFMFARKGADLTSEMHTIWNNLINKLLVT